MQFIDLGTQQTRIKKKIEDGFQKILNHGNYINGPEISELEKRLADYVGVGHAVGCSSGTDALLMGLMALGVGPGDAVFTTPFTFIATAEVIGILGATPVFVDIDPKTFNMDPEKLQDAIFAVKSKNSRQYPLPESGFSNQTSGRGMNPKGIIAVDLFGLCADYGKIEQMARQHGLFLIEDAAQSFGAELGKRRAGSFGQIGCTSFFPAKPLGAYGDGGMCFTDDENLNQLLLSIRSHGQGEDRYENVRIGINGRLDTIQAMVLLCKFELFREELELRQKVADRYNRLLSDTSLIVPAVPIGMKSAWAQYSLLAADKRQREAVMAGLKNESIPTAIYYPKPLHMQGAFGGLGYKAGAFPVSEDFSTRIFSLPMHPYLAEKDQERITDTILKIVS